jgi:hypothetical protein
LRFALGVCQAAGFWERILDHRELVFFICHDFSSGGGCGFGENGFGGLGVFVPKDAKVLSLELSPMGDAARNCGPGGDGDGRDGDKEEKEAGEGVHGVWKFGWLFPGFGEGEALGELFVLEADSVWESSDLLEPILDLGAELGEVGLEGFELEVSVLVEGTLGVELKNGESPGFFPGAGVFAEDGREGFCSCSELDGHLAGQRLIGEGRCRLCCHDYENFDVWSVYVGGSDRGPERARVFFK